MQDRCVHIIVPQISNRLKYIFDLFFKEQSGLSYRLHTDSESLPDDAEYVVSYDYKPSEKYPSFCATSLLFEKGVKDFSVKINWHEGIPMLFESQVSGFEMSYDFFAS